MSNILNRHIKIADMLASKMEHLFNYSQLATIINDLRIIKRDELYKHDINKEMSLVRRVLHSKHKCFLANVPSKGYYATSDEDSGIKQSVRKIIYGYQNLGVGKEIYQLLGDNSKKKVIQITINELEKRGIKDRIIANHIRGALEYSKLFSDRKTELNQIEKESKQNVYR